jgi:hypothetical protein
MLVGVLRSGLRAHAEQNGRGKQQGETKKAKWRTHGRSPARNFVSRFLCESNSDSERPICQAVDQQQAKGVADRRVPTGLFQASLGIIC